MFKLLLTLTVVSIGISVAHQSWWNSMASVANFKMAFEHSVEDEQVFDVTACDQIFNTATQRRICRSNVAAGNAAGLVAALDAAVRLAIKECKEQFKGDRWNCPIEWEPTLWTEGFSPESISFLQQGTKESAYLVAAISAALTHTVSHACAIGNLTDCSCTQSPSAVDNSLMNMMEASTTTTQANILSKSSLLSGITESSAKAAANAWQWGGCSENVQFGSFLSRKFLDPPALERLRNDAQDLLALVQLQNLQFGRKTLTSQLRVNCRCHGLSASCSVKTCFRQPSPFRQVAVALREKYEKALLAAERPELKAVAAAAASSSSKPVSRSPKKETTTVPSEDSSLIRNRLIRRKAASAKEESGKSLASASAKAIMSYLRNDAVLRDNLIHYKKSPSFCEPSPEWPHGTTGRVCSKPSASATSPNPLAQRLGMQPSQEDSNSTATAVPSCATLCCGRGYETKLVYVAESCRCVFKWCCEIKCETCWTTKEVHYCK